MKPASRQAAFATGARVTMPQPRLSQANELHSSMVVLSNDPVPDVLDPVQAAIRIVGADLGFLLTQQIEAQGYNYVYRRYIALAVSYLSVSTATVALRKESVKVEE